MNDVAPSPAPAINQAKKPGRKPALPPSEKVAALKAQLAAAEAEEREARKERAAIVGLALIEAMHESPEFAALARQHLKVKIKGARDKASIADLLIEG